MQLRKLIFVTALSLLAATSPALGRSTWYVDGVNGSDKNNCKSTQTACKTVGHAISLFRQATLSRLHLRRTLRI
jgi:hypothetical protein